MRGFATALDAALKEIGWNRSDLARAADRSTSTAAEWFSAGYRPSMKLLQQLQDLLPPEQFVQVLLAHLNDEIPPSARRLIFLAAADDNRVRESAADPLQSLPAHLRDLARWVGREMLTNEPFQRSMTSMRELLQGSDDDRR